MRTERRREDQARPGASAPGRFYRQRLARELWIGTGAAGLGVVFVMAWVFLTPGESSALGRKLGLLLAILGAFAVFLIVRARRWRGALERARRLGGWVCPVCLYQLVPEEQPVRCPECGLLVSDEVLRQAWDLTGIPPRTRSGSR